MDMRASKRNADRLNNLPDPIRSRIVSLLPTEEAVRTSILSRQWRHVCSSLSCLDFDLSSCENSNSKWVKTDFKNYVDKMLTSRNGTVLEKFSLLVKVDTEPITTAKLNNWLSIVVRHKVQNLHLFILSKAPQTLPSVFTCSTVIKLVLDNVNLQLPSVIRLPSLKYFRLHHVLFPSNAGAVDKLFSSSTLPVLEELEMLDCACGDHLSVSLPRLKRVRLFIRHSFFTINLSTPNLQELICEGRAVDISPDNFPSLLDATFDMICLMDFEYHSTTKVLCRARNVETLTFKNSFIQSLRRDKLLPKSVCSLSFTVKHLHLHVILRKTHMEVIYFLLPKFRELQTLLVYAEGHYGSDNYRDHYKLVVEEEPKNYQLRRVEFGNFRGTVIELDFVRYLFDSASVLQVVNISCSENMNPNTKKKVTKKLSSFRRISNNLKVRFLC